MVGYMKKQSNTSAAFRKVAMGGGGKTGICRNKGSEAHGQLHVGGVRHASPGKF